MRSSDRLLQGRPDRRPRVVHVINSLSTGGAETMLARLVSAGDAARFEHVVLPLMQGGPVTDRVREAGALATPLRVESAQDRLTAALRLAVRLRGLRPDLVQGWLLQGNLSATIGTALGLLRVPVLWNVRWTLYDLESEKWSTRTLMRVSGRLAWQPRRIIFNSGLAVSQHEGLGYPRNRARVIPNGFDMDHFRPDPAARDAVRRELDIGADAMVVGLVARYHPMKDHAMSVRAAASLVERHPDTMFVYAGRGVDSENEALSTLIAELGLVDRVRLLGERRDVARLYPAFDVYWMSSVARGVTEGFPNVIAEAMACGVPCVATDVGDAASIIGPTGRVVPSNDWRALADATAALLEAGSGGLSEMGRDARARIERDYSLDVVTDKYERLYSEVLAKARGRRSRTTA